VNDEAKLKRKAEVLLNLLLEDYARVEGLSNATFKDMIVNEEVECFAGYDDELGHLNEEVNLHDCISEDGMTLTGDHLLDYAKKTIHSEETQAVILDSVIKYDPHAIDKNINVNNIDYTLDGTNKRRNNEFVILTSHPTY